jgi:hypothetical protein
MTATGGSESKADGNVRATALKEWRQPFLRKLPIAATAGAVQEGDEGNSKKTSGTAGGFS